MSVTKRIGMSKDNKRIVKWVFYVFLYTTFIGILYGTVSYHFEDTRLFLEVYMSWEMFFITLGGFGWVLIALIIFKGKSFGE